ncbi:hypothetical protein NQZ79_g4635 [Umbelopsis isabellina]|nr:hypothetical protein NQZ79_g4635 [Umbelopsis isabellina]
MKWPDAEPEFGRRGSSLLDKSKGFSFTFKPLVNSPRVWPLLNASLLVSVAPTCAAYGITVISTVKKYAVTLSFQCDACCDVVKKPKLDQHRQRCWATFTCIDCSTTFQNQDYKSHTSCISEAEKYEKSGKNATEKKVVHQDNKSSKEVAKNSQPQSIIAELQNKDKEIDVNGSEEKQKTGDKSEKSEKKKDKKKDKKRKKDETVDSSPTSDQEISSKSKKSKVWNDKDLASDMQDNISLAISAVIPKDNEITFKDLRKKVIKKIASHPKNTAKKDDIKEAFEALKFIQDDNGRVYIK